LGRGEKGRVIELGHERGAADRGDVEDIAGQASEWPEVRRGGQRRRKEVRVKRIEDLHGRSHP